MPAKSSTYSVDAYEMIKRLIVTSEIRPNEVITEQALAAQLDIGRTPIREALKRLEQEGLVVTENRRKRVHALDLDEINQIFELKICIESAMVAQAAERAGEHDLQHIDDIMRKMEAHAAKIGGMADGGDRDRWFSNWMDLDADLHESIYRAAGNLLSIDIIRGINLKIHRFKLGMLTLQGRVAISVAEHRAFVDALLQRDPPRAEATMREHLRNVHQELVKLMRIFTA